MKYKIIISFIGIVFLACTQSNTVKIGDNCRTKIKMSDEVIKEFGVWTWQQFPLTDWSVCLPESYSVNFVTNKNDFKYLFGKENHRQWLMGDIAYFSIPNNKHWGWTDSTLFRSLPYIQLDVISAGKTDLPTVQDWINSEFEANPTAIGCSATNDYGEAKKLTEFSAPNYINIKEAISLKNGQGEAARFEACIHPGQLYAIKVKDEIIILNYPHGFNERNILGEELLEDIIEDIQLSENN